MLSPGTILSQRYLIDSEIGRGGYSVVYRARDTVLDSEVAIKLLVPPPAIAEVARERMRREVKAARNLTHDNIVGVHDFLETDDACYVVMELIDGLDLARHVSQHGPMAADEATRMGEEIARALTVAHRRGVLHRDVKPQNIMIDRAGKATLADFGSAKLEGQASMTHTGGVVGTLSFLAPEILRGRRPDARTDIYALGLTMFHALTGDMPARPTSQMPPEPRAAGYHPSSEAADVPQWLDNLVARMTSSEPHLRPATARDLADALAEGLPDDTPASVSRCLLCGEVDPLSLNICPRCGGVNTARSDTLLFLKRGADRNARHLVADALRNATRERTIPWVLRGSRALVRLPRDAAAAVQQRLAEQGVPLTAMRHGWAWAPMPASYYLMIFTLGVTALWAGLSLSLVALPVAGLFLCLGQLTLQRPAIRPARRHPLPGAVHREVVTALATLPQGTAHDLLAEIVHPARLLYQRLGEGHELTEPVSEILQAATRAAREIADLDDSLSGKAPRISGSALDTWQAKRAGIERTRDTLVQQLLELDSAVGYLHRRSASLTVARDELPSQAVDLTDGWTRHEAALREIEAFLAHPASTGPMVHH